MTALVVGINVKRDDPIIQAFLSHKDIFAEFEYSEILTVSLQPEEGEKPDDEILNKGVEHHPDLIIVVWEEMSLTQGVESILHDWLKDRIKHVIPTIIYADLEKDSSKLNFSEGGTRSRIHDEMVEFGHRLFTGTAIKDKYWSVVVVKMHRVRRDNFVRTLEWASYISKKIRVAFESAIAEAEHPHTVAITEVHHSDHQIQKTEAAGGLLIPKAAVTSRSVSALVKKLNEGVVKPGTKHGEKEIPHFDPKEVEETLHMLHEEMIEVEKQVAEPLHWAFVTRNDGLVAVFTTVHHVNETAVPIKYNLNKPIPQEIAELALRKENKTNSDDEDWN